jgi:hypothetical protein
MVSGKLICSVRRKGVSPMSANEAAIRQAYQLAEDKDVVGWVNCFTKDGQWAAFETVAGAARDRVAWMISAT